jgi:hypothetical protein
LIYIFSGGSSAVAFRFQVAVPHSYRGGAADAVDDISSSFSSLAHTSSAEASSLLSARAARASELHRRMRSANSVQLEELGSTVTRPVGESLNKASEAASAAAGQHARKSSRYGERLHS